MIDNAGVPETEQAAELGFPLPEADVSAAKGLPPGDGKYPAPHFLTFSQIANAVSRTYRHTIDQAIKHSRENAIALRRDPVVMDALRSRQMPVAQLAWHLEPIDDTDPQQLKAAAGLTSTLEDIPNFQNYRRILSEAVFFGRYGIQNVFSWDVSQGKKRLIVRDYKPVNGDKLVFKYSGQAGILVHAQFPGDWDYTELGRCHFLTPVEREQLVIHHFEPEDSDFFEPELAGGIYGVGIRGRVYWFWYLRNQVHSWLLDYLELVGAGGFTVFFYEQGNPTSLSEVKASVEAQYRNNAILFPRYRDSSTGGPGVQRIEPGIGGAQLLGQLVTDYFDNTIRRYILGQNLTSETHATGLGSGVADLHADTFTRIIKYDAVNLQETITRDLVRVLCKYNYPGVPCPKFVFDVDKPNAGEFLEAARAFYEMGGQVDEDELRGILGLAKPAPGHSILTNIPQVSPAGVGALPQGVPMAGTPGPEASMPQPPGEVPPGLEEEEEPTLFARKATKPPEAPATPLPHETGDTFAEEQYAKRVQGKLPSEVGFAVGPEGKPSAVFVQPPKPKETSPALQREPISRERILSGMTDLHRQAHEYMQQAGLLDEEREGHLALAEVITRLDAAKAANNPEEVQALLDEMKQYSGYEGKLNSPDAAGKLISAFYHKRLGLTGEYINKVAKYAPGLAHHLRINAAILELSDHATHQLAEGVLDSGVAWYARASEAFKAWLPKMVEADSRLHPYRKMLSASYSKEANTVLTALSSILSPMRNPEEQTSKLFEIMRAAADPSVGGDVDNPLGHLPVSGNPYLPMRWRLFIPNQSLRGETKAERESEVNTLLEKMGIEAQVGAQSNRVYVSILQRKVGDYIDRAVRKQAHSVAKRLGGSRPERRRAAWGTAALLPEHLSVISNAVEHFGGGSEGVVGFGKWLLDHHDVDELQYLKKKWGSGNINLPYGEVDEGGGPRQYRGAWILGQKVGPYTLNSLGVGDELTMDSWFWRLQYGIWSNLKGRKGLPDTPRGKEDIKIAKAAWQQVASSLNLTEAELQAVLWVRVKGLYQHLGSSNPKADLVSGLRKEMEKINDYRQSQGNDEIQLEEVGILGGPDAERWANAVREATRRLDIRRNQITNEISSTKTTTLKKHRKQRGSVWLI